MSFTGAIYPLNEKAPVSGQLTLIVRLVATHKSATTGTYYEVRSAPKQYNVVY